MNKIFIFIVLILFIAILGNLNFDKESEKKFRIATTFTIIADIASNIAGDIAIVESITKAGAEIHDYQPTPKDIIKGQKADLILWNGLNLERWFKKFFNDVKDTPTYVVSEGIDPLSIYEGEYKGKPNPHAWMSFSNALIYIENICNALIKHDKNNAHIYIKNAEEYKKKILSLKEKIFNLFDTIPSSSRWLVTSEGAFSYLAKDLGLKELYIWAINAEQQGTPQQLKKLIEKMNSNKIKVIFSESTISDRGAKSVAKQTEAFYGGILYVDSLSTPQGKVPTYLKLLEITTKTIFNGIKKSLDDELKN